MKRRFLFAAIIVAAAVVFAGCPSGGGNGEDTSQMPATTSVSWLVPDVILTWAAVPGAANGFTIMVDDIEVGVVTAPQDGAWIFNLATIPNRELFNDTHDVWVVTRAVGSRPASLPSESVSWEAGLPRLPGISIESMTRAGVLTWNRLFQDAQGEPVTVVSYGIYADGELVHTVPQSDEPTFTVNVLEVAPLATGFNHITMRAIGDENINRPSDAAEAGWLVVDPPGSTWHTIPNARFSSIPGFSTYGATTVTTEGEVVDVNVWSVLLDAQGDFVHLRITERAGDHMAPHIRFAEIIPDYVQTSVTPAFTPLEGEFTLETRVRPGQLRGGVAAAVGSLRKMGMQGNSGFFWQHPFTWSTGQLLVNEMPMEFPIRGDGGHVNQGANAWWDGMILSSCNVGEAVDMYFEDIIIRDSDDSEVWRFSEHIASLFVTPTSVSITGPDEPVSMSPGESVTFTAAVEPATAGQAVNWSIVAPADGVTIDVAGRVSAGPLAAGNRTVTATVPGVPALTATRTINITALDGITLGTPSGAFMLDAAGTVTVTITVGGGDVGTIVDFAAAVTGMPTGVTASGTMNIDAAGTGTSVITLSGTPTDPGQIGPHTITVIVGTFSETFVVNVEATRQTTIVHIVEDMPNRVAGGGLGPVEWLDPSGVRMTQNSADSTVIDFAFDTIAEVPDDWRSFGNLTVAFLDIVNNGTGDMVFTFAAGFGGGARQFGTPMHWSAPPSGNFYRTVEVADLTPHGGSGPGFSILTWQGGTAGRSSNFSWTIPFLVFHDGPFDTSLLPGAQALAIAPNTASFELSSADSEPFAVTGANITAASGNFTPAMFAPSLPASITPSGSFTVDNGDLTGTLTLTFDGTGAPLASAPFTMSIGAANTVLTLEITAAAGMPTVTVGAQVGEMEAASDNAVTFPVTTTNINDDTTFAGDNLYVANLPAGVSIQGDVVINGNAGTLTLVGSAASVEGTFATLALRLGPEATPIATSPAFTLTIAPAQPVWPTAVPPAPTPTDGNWTSADGISIGTAGPVTVTMENGSRIVTGRGANWHSLEIGGAREGDEVVVVGRVSQIWPVGGQMVLQQPWAQGGFETFITENVDPSSTFELRFTADIAPGTIRIQTNDGNTSPFAIDHVAVFRDPGAAPPDPFENIPDDAATVDVGSLTGTVLFDTATATTTITAGDIVTDYTDDGDFLVGAYGFNTNQGTIFTIEVPAVASENDVLHVAGRKGSSGGDGNIYIGGVRIAQGGQNIPGNFQYSETWVREITLTQGMIDNGVTLTINAWGGGAAPETRLNDISFAIAIDQIVVEEAN